MLKSILKLDGAQELSKEEQKQVNGGRLRRTPCWPTSYDIIPWWNSPEACAVHGGIWFNNQCYLCH